MPWTFYNATGEAMIIDGGVQASAAVFTGKVDLGSNLLVGNDGTTGIAISANGEVNMAAQPCFLAYTSADTSNRTGAGASTHIDFDTEVFDVNSDFASYTFTAPVTGKYLLATHVRTTGRTSASTYGYFRFNTSNRLYVQYQALNHNTEDSFSLTGIVDMDSGDTVTVLLTTYGESGNTVDISSSSSPVTAFSGQLIS